MDEIRRFKVYRSYDESGVSGIGYIMSGVIFHTGKTVICWRTDITGSKNGVSSIGIYDTYDEFLRIHVTAHPMNRSRIEFY